MKTTVAFISILVSLVLQGQVPMLQEDNERYYDMYCSTVPNCGYTHFQVGEEINIGGHTGSIVHKTMEHVDWEFPYVTQEILRQSGDTVYRYSDEADLWHILYDFGAQEGDVWDIQTGIYVGITYANLPVSF